MNSEVTLEQETADDFDFVEVMASGNIGQADNSTYTSTIDLTDDGLKIRNGEYLR